jgi:Big-like domain-containing protein
MPPLASLIVVSIGSIAVVLGVIVLLAMHTATPRAKPTLVVWGREWRVRAVATVGLLAGALCLALIWVYAPVSPRNEAFHAADRPRSPADDRHASPAPGQAREVFHGRVGRVTDESVGADPPGLPQAGPPQESPHDGPVNLTGEWRITNTIVETSYPPYRQLRLGFRLAVRHEGAAFTAAGEKDLENGRPIPAAARSPIRLQGRVRDGSVIEATFQEDGRSRHIEGHFRLTLQDRRQLTGTFVSTAANARGASQWVRAPARQGAPRREPPSQEGGYPHPAPEPEAPPAVTLVAPVQGQQVTAAQLQVRGTATSPRGLAWVDIKVNGERQAQRTASGQTTVDFSEPLALRYGPNVIVVTAVDPQHRSAGRRVTVTRLEPSAGGSAPADQRTAQQSPPRLHLGMSQAEVRALLGEPVSVEETLAFVFWHYGAEAYVVFDERTGRVHGWLGVAS